ncbi:MAG: SDR family NAD(P)-dependent oxidoreductase [Acidobacteriaceae bacterium]
MAGKKTAIITGASHGIGAGLVTAFLKRGYRVVANSRTISKSNAFPVSEDLILVDGDIGQPETAQRIDEAAISRFGSIDVLVNNAGIFLVKPFIDYTTADFNALISTNLAGLLYVTQLAVKQMLKQKSGSIVNISTSLVEQPIAGVPAAVPMMTKGGIQAVTRSLAIEYATRGIRVNAVAPGIVDTPMHKPEERDYLKTLQPVGEIASIQDVVSAVLYLTDASFVTGEVLHVDGGAHAGRW